MQPTKNHESHQANRKYHSSWVIEASASPSKAELTVHGLDSQLNNLCCSSRVGSRGVARANVRTRFEFEPFEFISANRFEMESTGCRCSPNAYPFASGDDREGVTSANVLNFIERNNDCSEWIDDLDSFIKNEQLGFDENQPHESRKKNDENDAGKRKIGIEEQNLDKKQQEKNAGNCCQNDGASRSKNSQVRHSISFAGLSLTPAEERK